MFVYTLCIHVNGIYELSELCKNNLTSIRFHCNYNMDNTVFHIVWKHVSSISKRLTQNKSSIKVLRLKTNNGITLKVNWFLGDNSMI